MASPKYFWNPTTQTYETPDGPISPDTIREWIDQAILFSVSVVGELSRRFVKGLINRATWHNAIQNELVVGHIGVAEIASGGKAQFTQVQAQRTGIRLREQLAYLDNFAAEVASPTRIKPVRPTGPVVQQFSFLERAGLQVSFGLPQQMSGDAIVSRSELYPEAFRATFEGIRRGNHLDAGFTVERSILGGGGDSCSECIAEEERGWVPIGDLIPVGSRQCLTRCHCTQHYSTEAWEM